MFLPPEQKWRFWSKNLLSTARDLITISITFQVLTASTVHHNIIVPYDTASFGLVHKRFQRHTPFQTNSCEHSRDKQVLFDFTRFTKLSAYSLVVCKNSLQGIFCVLANCHINKGNLFCISCVFDSLRTIWH